MTQRDGLRRCHARVELARDCQWTEDAAYLALAQFRSALERALSITPRAFWHHDEAPGVIVLAVTLRANSREHAARLARAAAEPLGTVLAVSVRGG